MFFNDENNSGTVLSDADIKRMTVQLATAYASRNPISSPDDLFILMDKIRANLLNNTSIIINQQQITQNNKATETQEEKQNTETTDNNKNEESKKVDLVPAVPIEDSITEEYLYCLEDGKSMKSLTRYLKNKYNLSPDQYRLKWGLKRDYPMSAPATAEKRSQRAIERGFGKKPTDQPATETAAPETAPEEQTEA